MNMKHVFNSNPLRYTAVLGLFAILLAISCTSEKEPLPDECEGSISLQTTIGSEANCGQSTGSFTVVATGGSAPYTYALNGGTAQSSASFDNLAAGSYTLTVTDNSGCTAEISVNIANQDGVNASISGTTASDCDTPNGSISVSATDGAGPYQYKLNDNAFQSGNTFDGLAPGNYTVTVRDANNCEVSLQATIKSDVVFAQVKNIIQTNCAVSGCHNGTTFPDLRVDNNIAAQASRIKARTGAKTMPPSSSGRSLSDDEIAEIACWVNDGASLN
jgi:hypothetical protein